jgi:hypothetical protein
MSEEVQKQENTNGHKCTKIGRDLPIILFLTLLCGRCEFEATECNAVELRIAKKGLHTHTTRDEEGRE